MHSLFSHNTATNAEVKIHPLSPTEHDYESEVKQKVEKYPSPRGLAVIVSNDYKNSNNKQLNGTEKDGKAMKDAFESLKFVTIWKHNVSEKQHRQLINGVLQQLKHAETDFKGNPSGQRTHPFNTGFFKCIVYVFSGHGNIDELSMEDGNVHLKGDVISKLTYNSDNERQLFVKMPKLFFIDACRTRTNSTVQDPTPVQSTETMTHVQHSSHSIPVKPGVNSVLHSETTTQQNRTNVGSRFNPFKWLRKKLTRNRQYATEQSQPLTRPQEPHTVRTRSTKIVERPPIERAQEEYIKAREAFIRQVKRLDGENFLLAYATTEEKKSHETSSGGYWMQLLAEEIAHSDKSVLDILCTVKERLKMLEDKNPKRSVQQPETVERLNCVLTLHLREQVSTCSYCMCMYM